MLAKVSVRSLDPGPRLGPEPLPGPAVPDPRSSRRRRAEHPGLPASCRRPRRLGKLRGPAPGQDHRDTPDPPGGKILKDAKGEPTGILVDRAEELVDTRSRFHPRKRSSRPSSVPRTSSSPRASPPSTRWGFQRASRTSTGASHAAGRLEDPRLRPLERRPGDARRGVPARSDPRLGTRRPLHPSRDQGLRRWRARLPRRSPQGALLR